MINIKKKKAEKELQQFIFYTSKLEAIEFMGLVRIFNVDIFKNDEQKTPRTFEEILSDIIDGFIKATPRQKKNIMKILKAAADKKQ